MHNPTALPAVIGKTISRVVLDDDQIKLWFNDNSGIFISDAGQSCCESRYITTDDELTALVGQTLVRIDQEAGPDLPGCGSSKTCFVEIRTAEGGSVTFVTHNEHNGYYGGFYICIRSVSEE